MSDLGLHTHLRQLPALRVFWMFWGGLALLDVLDGQPAWLRLGGLVLLAAACARHTSVGTCVVVAGTGWLLVNGFVDNAYGQLALHGDVDLLEAGLLLVVTLAAARR